MVETLDEAAPDPAKPATTWVDRVRFVLRGIGQTLVTAGVVVLLFVVYEVYVTDYFAKQEQSKVKATVQKQWRDVEKDPLLKLPDGSLPALPEGKGIAFLYIPRLGRDFSWAVVEGTSDADLQKGPGHYKDMALPGQVGNFGVAGHRVGHGAPFLNLDHLRVGDAVIVQTESKWYVYRVKGQDHGDIESKDADGIPGREIVGAGDSSVLDDVPGHSGAAPTERLLTLTTCHPKFTSKNRMIVHAVLTKTVRANGLQMPASVAALYDQQES